MKTCMKLAIIAGALGLAVQANASWYSLSFTATYNNGSGTTAANGQLDVVSGVAIGGWLDVTSGANTGVYNLSPTPGTYGGVLGNGPVGFTYDNLVTPGANPFLNIVNPSGLDAGGLGFQDVNTDTYFWLLYINADESSYLGTHGLGGTEANSYALLGYSPNNGLEPQAYGDASLTAVPEPATLISGALLLLPFGSSAVRQLRKKLQAA